MSFNDDFSDGNDTNLKGVSGNAVAPEFASDGVLKGIGGGKGKSRTPRPIKPPGVYVNGKATAKTERKKGEAGDGGGADLLGGPSAMTPPLAPPTEEALQMDSSALDEFKALAQDGSQEFREYLDFSVQARAKLEGDVLLVLQLLEDAGQRASDLCSEAGKKAGVGNGGNLDDDSGGGGGGSGGGDDGTLIAALEARHLELEGQLTEVWDELLVKDEGFKKVARQLDEAKREQLTHSDRAGKEITKQAKELTAVKAQVASVYKELETSRAQVGALHEQVDALTQKLQMEESSKKSLKAQLDKVTRASAQEAKRNAALQEEVSGDKALIKRRLRKALELRHLNGAALVFAFYCQARSLQMKAAAAARGGPLSQPTSTALTASSRSVAGGAGVAGSNNSSGGGSDNNLASSSLLLVGSGANPLSSSALLLSAVAGKEKAGAALARELSGGGGGGGGEDNAGALEPTALKQFVRTADAAAVVARLARLAHNERSQRQLNAQLLSTVQSLKHTIQVYARIRPFSDAEAKQYKGQRAALAAQQALGSGSSSSSSSSLTSPKGGLASQQPGIQALSACEVGVYDSYAQTWKGFTFDRVWGPETSQVDLFIEVEPLALSVVDGVNSCILAYGQTGSGKTHTMHGGQGGGGQGAEEAEDPRGLGLSYRTVHKIFTLLQMHKAKHAEAGHSYEFAVKVAMLEVYNDELRDLLSHTLDGEKSQPSHGKALEVRQGSSGEVVVPELSWVATQSIAEAMAVFDAGNGARATASTTLNIHSSRSHMVMVIEVATLLHGASEPTVAKLHLVDLAGSERVKQSEAAGLQLKEAQHINKSLSALGDVMEALDSKAKFVPFRNSKLTFLLQGCLGGGCRTAMVVTCCPTPHTVDESSFTLQFGVRCRRVGLGGSGGGGGSGAGGGSGGGPGGPGGGASYSKNLEEALRKAQVEVRSLAHAKAKLEANLIDSGGGGGGEATSVRSKEQQMATLRQLQGEKAELRGALTALRADLTERDATIKALGGKGGPPTTKPPPPPPPPKTTDGGGAAASSLAAAAAEREGSSEGWAPKSSKSSVSGRRGSSAQRRDPSSAKPLPPGDAPTTDLLAPSATTVRAHTPRGSTPRSSSGGGGASAGGSVERRTRRGLVSHSPTASGMRRSASGSGAVQSYTQSLATTTAARSAASSSSPTFTAAASPTASMKNGSATLSPSDSAMSASPPHPPPPPPPPPSSSSSSIRSFMRMRQSGTSSRGTSKDSVSVPAPATSPNGGAAGAGAADGRPSTIEAGVAAAAAISSIASSSSSSAGRSGRSRSNSSGGVKPSSPSSSVSAGPAARRVSSTFKAAREGSPIRALAGRLAAPAPRSRGSSPVGSSGRLTASPRNSVQASGELSNGDGTPRPTSESRRSNSASRFFGRPSSSSSASSSSIGDSTALSSSSSGGGPSLRPGRSDSNEPPMRRGNDPSPSPATRRADAAKKHAARMQAVRASSGKGRWGNSV